MQSDAGRLRRLQNLLQADDLVNRAALLQDLSRLELVLRRYISAIEGRGIETTQSGQQEWVTALQETRYSRDIADSNLSRCEKQDAFLLT